MEEAWNFQDDDRVVDAPKFLNDDRWDLIAKAPAELAGLSADNSIDYETMDGMLKALLTERFHLAAHMEMRPMPAWTLTSVKPKMKKADPEERIKCVEGPATLFDKDPRNDNPVLGRLLTCQNASMQYLAERLQYLANGYIQSDVLDSTGLESGWDFTLSFSTSAQLSGQPAPAGSVAAPLSEPNGAISLPDAMEKQLGLKLQQQKRLLPVLVIDHIDQKATEN